MKVAIGYRLQKGPWGGGNQFGHALAKALKNAGHEVCFDLDCNDIDIILLTEVRGRSKSGAFTAGAVLRYLWMTNMSAIVVHRINECDERKGTSYVNALLCRSNYVADHTVFVGAWLRNLPVWQGGGSTVILNGADAGRFRPDSCNAMRQLPSPMRIVTHHWGGNWMKGFDAYSFIDQMLGENEWREKFEFTYIGNMPPRVKLPFTRVIAPLSGSELADELASHHVYLTGSLNDPGPMHPLEAGLCGLPLIYRASGALPEYCNGYGLAFDSPEELPNILNELLGNYGHWQARMKGFPHTADKMSDKYISLFNILMESRDEIVARRRLWRSPWQMIRNQIPA